MRVVLPILAVLLAQLSAFPAVQGRRELEWQEWDRSERDLAQLSPRAEATLNLPDIAWKHAATAHFVVHFEKEIFARKVARMAEFFYDYVSADIQAPEDLIDGRSHIFIFRSPERWQAFQAMEPGGMEWAFSMVQGQSMYLQQADDTESSADVLAHEMSHLILNRFFRERPATWLNEGLAEWYGEFAYAAFKGIKKSQRTRFKRLEHPYPLELLLSVDGYPEDTVQIQAYYETSKFLVAYLRLGFPPEKFVAYLHEVMGGAEATATLEPGFGLGNVEAIRAGLSGFLR